MRTLILTLFTVINILIRGGMKRKQSGPIPLIR